MDYHARHGHDVCSFDLPSTHRLPTVSAAQALEELDADSSTYISTSLPDLDRALVGKVLGEEDGSQEGQGGGIVKGQIIELWGPPGIGKTTLGIQAAANVLREGKSVVWVDCFHPVNRERLIDICTAAEAATEGDKDAFAGPLDRLVHFACPSLAHFIALLCRPTESTLPTDTVLIVVDSLSAVINHAFPRTPPTPKGVPKVNNKGPPLAARRIQVLQYIVGALQKLAATRDAAVVVLTQCATRMQAERGATLVPAVNTNVWDQGIASRVALYRDWVWADGRTAGARFAAVQKVNGRVVEAEALEKACAFEIESTGIIPRDYDGIKPESAVSYTPMQKRKLGETGFEVPDSEGDDEDYGWGDDDDTALPRPPPQWQGSEDVILGQHPETDEVEGSSIDDTDPGPEAEQAPQDD